MSIEDYITYHSQHYFSGFYDGQWRLLPLKHKNEQGDWYDPAIDDDVKIDKKELQRLGPDFEMRGFTSGKAQFAMDFDKVIQDVQANQIIQDIQKERQKAGPDTSNLAE